MAGGRWRAGRPWASRGSQAGGASLSYYPRYWVIIVLFCGAAWGNGRFCFATPRRPPVVAVLLFLTVFGVGCRRLSEG